ncbi:RNA 2'-phosphotransferase, partial [Tetragenococcus muriaticus]
GREFVHLSENLETAKKIGRRHADPPAVFYIYALKAAENGYAFYSTKSGIWLVELLPASYLLKMS